MISGFEYGVVQRHLGIQLFRAWGCQSLRMSGCKGFGFGEGQSQEGLALGSNSGLLWGFRVWEGFRVSRVNAWGVAADCFSLGFGVLKGFGVVQWFWLLRAQRVQLFRV